MFIFIRSQISGLGLVIAGALVISDINEFNHFLEGRVTAPPIVLIITGAIIFLIASLGCYGAIRESTTMLYAVIYLKNKLLIDTIASIKLNKIFSLPSSC